MSLVRARQTGMWRADMRPTAEPVYDAADIARTVSRLRDDERIWQSLFA